MRFDFVRTSFVSLFSLLVAAGAAAQALPQEPAPVQEPATTAPVAVAEPSPAPAPEVTLKRIMAHPDWIGNAPERPYWADDGQSIFYFQKVPGEETRNLVEIDLQGRVLRTVSEEERGTIDSGGGVYNRDFSRKLYLREGDLFLKELPDGPVRQLTKTAARERGAHFLDDGRRIAFQRGDDLLIRDLESGLEEQAAELRLEEDPDEKEEKPDYLRDQQPRLLDYIREQKEKKEAERLRTLQARDADSTRLAPPFYLGDKVEVNDLSLSPSGEWLLVTLGKKGADRGKGDKMPVWVTESGYLEVRDVRPKVGTGDGSGQQLVLLDLVRGESYPLSLGGLPGITDDPLAELREAAEARREAQSEDGEIEEEELPWEEPPVTAEEGEEEAAEGEGDGEMEAGLEEEDELATEEVAPEGEDVESAAEGEEEDAEEDEEKGDPRALFFSSIEWSPDGSTVALMAHSVDNKDRWIATVTPTRGSEPQVEPLHRLHDPAWINWSFNEMGWLPEGDRLWFLSEESGYSHLYVGAPAFGSVQPLTSGDFLVENVTATRDGAQLYFDANPTHPGIYDRYRVAAAGGPIERMTTTGGRSTAELSPDGRNLLVTHSSTTRPPELFLQSNEVEAEATQLTQTASAEFLAIDWVAPEIRGIPSSHVDRPIYSRIYRPEGSMFEPASQPAVVFVHGAGYLQNAHHGWSGYFREFMFHSLLTHQGYVVLDMDYRASRGYGRDWRTAIYRQMGTPELEDLQDGVEWLVTQEGMDRDRIGVYGGSYGGFMTFMALFKDPDLFAAGAALRPVTDWAHYNHPYTSNILNTPDIDPEAYERSSPIEFADGLEKPLLICAPMLDDNVFFLDTVRLVQRLIELEKENWEVALYPVEAHGFTEPSSWLDEYRRIFKLFERYLK